MYEPTTAEQLHDTTPAPAVYQPQHLAPVAYGHQLQHAFPVPAADPRRALVQVEETGQWVLAHVPAAPPVIVQAAPTATPRRPLSALERGAIVVVSSVCALTLTGAGALAMVGAATLTAAADLAIGGAVLLGTTLAGLLGLRAFGSAGRPSSPTAPAAAPPAPVTVTVNGTGGQGGRWGSRGGTGVRIDRLTINGN